MPVVGGIAARALWSAMVKSDANLKTEKYIFKKRKEHNSDLAADRKAANSTKVRRTQITWTTRVRLYRRRM